MREIVTGLYIFLYTLVTAPLRYKNMRGTDEAAIQAGHAKNYKMAQKLARTILKIAGAKLHVQGIENLPQEKPALYMGTHKSYMDIVIMIALIDDPLIFIGKSEIDKLPLIRTWFNATGAIYIDRSDIRQSFKVIVDAIDQLKKGNSVAVFPEGTRAKGETIGDFKVGSFKLATRANVPIVPIAMQNTFKLLEEKRRLRPAQVGVNIGKVIDVSRLSKEEKKTISKDTQNYIEGLLNQITKQIKE